MGVLSLFLWAAASIVVVEVLLLVWHVGKPRHPVTGGMAVAGLLEWGGIAVLLVWAGIAVFP